MSAETKHERRQAKKTHRVNIAKVILVSDTGETIEIDARRINIIDRRTGKPLFEVLQEAEATDGTNIQVPGKG